MKLSIIIVNHKGLEHTRNAVKSVIEFSPHSEIIVVDNNSADGSVEALYREFPNIRVVPLAENQGFGAGNNRGAAAANGEFLFFLNNDAVLVEDTPRQLAEIMVTDPAVGACGPKLLNSDRSFQLSFGCDPSLLNEWKFRRMQRRLGKARGTFRTKLENRYRAKAEVDWVTGAALMIRRKVFQEVGGFDQTFFMYFEDADVCRRIRKLGWKVLYVPTTQVVHLLGQSAAIASERTSAEYRRSQLHYYRKHSSRFAQLLLRLYLIFKFGTRRVFFLWTQCEQRSVAEEIVRLALRSPSGQS